MADEKVLLTEAEGYSLLRRYHIPVPDHIIVQDRDDARREAEKIGFPVVMKIVSPDVSHKSDVGGVITGIRTPEEAEQAFDTIVTRIRAALPSGRITGLIIEKEMPEGLQLLIGGKIDPSFGRVLTFGMGGTLVELLKDVSLRVLPITREEIRAMIRRIRGYRLIEGYRDFPPRDEDALIDIIEKVIALFSTDERLVEFDINPLLLYEKGGCVVDARFFILPTPQKFNPPVVEDAPPRLFHPLSLAVVGASSDPNKIGYVIMRNLLSFPGTLYPVNPHHETILGRKAYPSLRDLPDAVDLVVVA
ncbi:MAG: acetate--CoA ligase family protein, partial [Methanomicrobiales archaeon]|nr:acetate--CoA ligase family protein [Methanomicrobiales archaeon]